MIAGKIIALIVGAVLCVWLLLAEFAVWHIGSAESWGDTSLAIDGTQLTLWGVAAAPVEKNCAGERGGQWPCGAVAMSRILDAVRGKSLWCSERGSKHEERTLARCYVSAGFFRWKDVARELVRDGWLIADPDQAKEYVKESLAARDAGRGLWHGSSQT